MYGGRLPVHVRCLLDEVANIGQIPKLEKLIATIRSREISACLILQAQSQLKAIYKDNADTITGNCDTTLFLGGKEKTTLKEMSELLGRETIDLYNTSENRGKEKTYGLNYQKLGKELMSQDDSTRMKRRIYKRKKRVSPFHVHSLTTSRMISLRSTSVKSSSPRIIRMISETFFSSETVSFCS